MKYNNLILASLLYLSYCSHYVGKVKSSFVCIDTKHNTDFEYFPDSLEFGNIWKSFYQGNHEQGLSNPLIRTGKPMVNAICNAIQNRNMKYRRYAIVALGPISDSIAIITLTKILKDSTELECIRGDALQAIYKINNKTGKYYSEQFKNTNNYLNQIWHKIENQENWRKTKYQEE
jgi:hypothetical protein